MLQSFITAFSGTAVEFFETIAIAYALIRVGHRQEAVSATVLGHVLVFAAAYFIWPVHQFIPVFWFRLAAALSLAGMGAYWTLKSVKRLWKQQRPRWVENPLGKIGVEPTAIAPVATAAAFVPFVFFVMLKSSVIEAFEILLVIFPVGAAGGHWPAIMGGVASAILVVVILATLLHGQLKKIPEVKIKLVTGLLLLAIGLSWLFEL